jgi:hypothetical protein
VLTAVEDYAQKGPILSKSASVISQQGFHRSCLYHINNRLQQYHMEGDILYDKENGLFWQPCAPDNSNTGNITYGFTYRRPAMRLRKTIILTCLIGISVAFTLTGCGSFEYQDESLDTSENGT